MHTIRLLAPIVALLCATLMRGATMPDERELVLPKPIPPAEWQQFEREMQDLQKMESPRLEDIQRVQGKWFARWGILDQIQKQRAEVEALRRKYQFALDPSIDAGKVPGYYDTILESIVEFSTDPRVFDPEGWICNFETDETAALTVTLLLKPNHYAGFKPEKVKVVLRSGGMDMPTPSLQTRGFETELPLVVETVGEGAYRIRFRLQESLREGLVLQVRAVMELRWIVYGIFRIPGDNNGGKEPGQP